MHEHMDRRTTAKQNALVAHHWQRHKNKVTISENSQRQQNSANTEKEFKSNFLYTTVSLK